MRVMQVKSTTSWVNKSQSPGESVAALAVCGSDLVDDQKLITYVGELRLQVLSEAGAITFFAKDEETLTRGLSFLAKRTKSKAMAYALQTDNRTGIALWAGSWHRGDLRHANKVTAGLSAIGGNILEFGRRGIANLILTLETLDVQDMKKLDEELYYSMRQRSKDELKDTFNVQGRYTSFKDVMRTTGRDGRLVQNGAFVYACRAMDLPRQIDCGKVQTQIPSVLTMDELALKTKQLFH